MKWKMQIPRCDCKSIVVETPTIIFIVFSLVSLLSYSLLRCHYFICLFFYDCIKVNEIPQTWAHIMSLDRGCLATLENTHNKQMTLCKNRSLVSIYNNGSEQFNLYVSNIIFFVPHALA